MKLKLFFLAIFTLLSVNCFASGKISVQGNYFWQSKQWFPQVGLSVYERLVGNTLAYESWTGGGGQDFELHPDIRWYTTKQDLVLNLGHNLALAGGVQISYIRPYNEFNNNAHVKLSVKLW